MIIFLDPYKRRGLREDDWRLKLVPKDMLFEMYWSWLINPEIYPQKTISKASQQAGRSN